MNKRGLGIAETLVGIFVLTMAVLFPAASISNPVATTYQTKFANWSPDGSQLVTQGWYAGDDKVFVQNADGTGAMELEDSTYFGEITWVR